ncbi:MAG: hypothetical protein GY940_36195, partial [bacterium]|nr:hypothetical protein [bacterium]
ENEPEQDLVRIGINVFPSSLNPVYATGETSLAVVNKMFGSLFYFDANGSIANGLAESTSVERNNGTAWIVIRLKRGVFFSDGKELEAKDVEQTVKLLQNTDFKFPYLSNIRFIKEIRVTGPHELRITMNNWTAPWKKYLTFMILNWEELKNADPETFRNKRLSGTGPYRLKAVRKRSKVVMELNPFFRGAVRGITYRHIEFTVVSYPSMTPLKLFKHEIDICELQPENVSAYRFNKEWRKEFKLLEYQKFAYTYLVFNLKNNRLTKNIRRHFYNILVCGDFTGRFLKGSGKKVSTPFLLLDPKTVPTRMDVEPLDQPVTLKILVNGESKIRRNFIAFLKEELKPRRILLEPLHLEYHTFLDYLKKGRFDLAISGFMLDIDYDMKDIFHSGSYFNYAGLRSPDMDRLLEQGLQEPDPKKRENIYIRAHGVWLEELPLLPLFNLYYYVGVAKNIKPPDEIYKLVGSTGDFLFNIHQWKRE